MDASIGDDDITPFYEFSPTIFTIMLINPLNKLTRDLYAKQSMDQQNISR